MDSRKMVLMDLLAGQQWRCRHRGDSWTQRRRERLGRTERAAWKYTLYHVWNGQPVGICCMTQGAQISLCDNLHGWDGRSLKVPSFLLPSPVSFLPSSLHSICELFLKPGRVPATEEDCKQVPGLETLNSNMKDRQLRSNYSSLELS